MMPRIDAVGIHDSIAFYQQMNVMNEEIVEEALKRYGRYVIKKIREYIENADVSRYHIGAQLSGRLVNSINDSNDGDSIFEVKKQGSRWTLIIGTRVPYAMYIEHGFTFTGPRTVNIANIGWRVVRSFEYEGVHMFEKGLTRHTYMMNFELGKALKRAGYKGSFTHLFQGTLEVVQE